MLLPGGASPQYCNARTQVDCGTEAEAIAIVIVNNQHKFCVVCIVLGGWGLCAYVCNTACAPVSRLGADVIGAMGWVVRMGGGGGGGGGKPHLDHCCKGRRGECLATAQWPRCEPPDRELRGRGKPAPA